MEAGTIKRIVFAVIATILVVHFSYVAGRRDGFNLAVEAGKEKMDTLYLRDTIVQYDPILEERVVYKREYVPVPVTDTLWKHDTLYVSLDHEQVVWQDSLSKVYASGIMPQIDSVQHFVSERIVTRELTQVVKKPCRWGIGVNVGYGGTYNNGRVFASPYIGIGISYNIISW